MRPLALLTALTLPLPASDLYTGTGEAPRHTYRIPTLAVTPKGTLLAFAELRKHGAGDSGDIDTVVRRSTDGGKTWSEESVVLDMGGDTIGNACPVVDPATHRITVIATWNRVPEAKTAPGYGDDSRLVMLTRSDDDGRTWSAPEDISRQVKAPDWSWFATGPGSGIVLSRGPHAGRFVIGVNHRGPDGYRAHTILSDDAGKTWRSSSTFAALHTNECEVAELTDGTLMLNMRNHGSRRTERAVALSSDGGETWGETRWDAALPEPQCMGSLIRHRFPGPGQPGLLLFSNPASRTAREDLTLRGSHDDGATWPMSLVLHPGAAAYSHLAALPDGTIVAAYEADGYRRIVFRRIHPDRLENPGD